MSGKALLFASVGAAWIAMAGCQMLASLDVPTYAPDVGGAGGGGSGSGGGPTGGMGGSTSTGDLPCTESPAPESEPPCPEHIALWLVADREESVTRDADGFVTEWRDVSGAGWTAAPTTAGTVQWVSLPSGQEVVRFANAGMKLDPHGAALDLSELGIFVAAKVAKAPAPDGNHPYQTADLVCLRPLAQKAPIRVHLGIEQDQNKYLLAGVFSNGVENTAHVGAGSIVTHWSGFGFTYACDSECQTRATSPERAAFVDTLSEITPWGDVDMTSPSLDPDLYPGWNGVWTEGTIGSFCEDPLRGGVDADIGEVIVYDRFIEPTLADQLKQYLENRWDQ